MNSIEFNPELAKEGSGNTGKYINESGGYTGMFKKAYLHTYDSGAKAIMLEFETSEGKEANFLKLFIENAEGKPLAGLKKLHAIMATLKLNRLNLTKGPVEINGNVEDRVLYTDLINKNIGLVLQKRLYVHDSKEKSEILIYAPFSAETRQTANEVLDAKPAENLDKILANLTDFDERGKAPTKNNSSNNDAQDDYFSGNQAGGF